MFRSTNLLPTSRTIIGQPSQRTENINQSESTFVASQTPALEDNRSSSTKKTRAGIQGFGWLTGNANSIQKLDSGPVLQVSNIKNLDDAELGLLGQHFGLAAADDLAEKIKAPLLKFNEILRLSHYGKRAAEGELLSKDYELLTQEEWKTALPIDDAEMAQLNKAANKIHLNIAVSKAQDQVKKSVLLYFLGSETKSMTDNFQLIGTAMNAVGPVYKEIPALVKTFQRILEKNPDYQLDLVSGHSLGAGVAQCFAMAIGNPNLIMLDPQLLTDKQADLVGATTDKIAAFNKPHGIAITVDYEKHPCDGLMNKMKAWKFKHPGILQLEMPLQASDGNGVIYKKDKRTGQRIASHVEAEPKAGKFGYHGAKPDMLLFNYAIERFVG